MKKWQESFFKTKRQEVRRLFDEYNGQLAAAEDEIAGAKKELKAVKTPAFYQYDRFEASSDYSSFYGDAQKIDSIAKVFPVFFILVAALVCLTTMTRMVEEQRTQIGTYKAFRIQWGKNSWKVSFLCSNSGISRKLHRRCCWIADLSEDNL